MDRANTIEAIYKRLGDIQQQNEQQVEQEPTQEGEQSSPEF